MTIPLNPDTSERKAFHDQVSEAVRQYLEIFPEEQARLQELQLRLADSSLDLRQRSTIPEGHMCASGIILLPGSKVLMLEHKALGIWVVPGGHYDVVDPNLAATAIRESLEETGLTGITLHPWHVVHGSPLDIDTHIIPRNEKKHEGEHPHFDFRYVLVLENPEKILENLRLDANEVVSFKLMNIAEIDSQSSIAPALKKLSLLAS